MPLDPPIAAPAPPRASGLEAVPGLAATLSSDVRFGIAGLGFAGHVLHVRANLGWLEVRGDKPVAMHRWSDRDNVVNHHVLDGGWVKRFDALYAKFEGGRRALWLSSGGSLVEAPLCNP